MTLMDGPKLLKLLRAIDVTDLVWIPDSTLGAWDREVSSASFLRVIRPAREGEAIAIGAGLWIGGRRPIVAMQCTGFFEAGDALRNVIHDMRIPLWMLVGIRGYFAARSGAMDSAMEFIGPIVDAWRLPHTWITSPQQVDSIPQVLRAAYERQESHVVLLAE